MKWNKQSNLWIEQKRKFWIGYREGAYILYKDTKQIGAFISLKAAKSAAKS